MPAVRETIAMTIFLGILYEVKNNVLSDTPTNAQ
jgi:hypothetical protein